MSFVLNQQSDAKNLQINHKKKETSLSEKLKPENWFKLFISQNIYWFIFDHFIVSPLNISLLFTFK